MTVTADDLRRFDLFEGVTTERLEEWAAAADDVRLERGDVLVAFDDVDIGFSLLLEGSLDGYLMIDGRV